MALQAYKAHVGARQHARIGRAMRLMTRLAAFKAQRRMFEGERPPLVAVTFEAPRIVGCEGLQHRGADAAVRIVAIHAAHVAFGKLVMEGPLELGPLVQVAARAQLVDRVGLPQHQRLALVHFVAGGAGNLVVGVAAFETPYLRGLIQMAGEADFVGRRGRQFRWILDIVGRGSFGVRLAGTVTGLALAAHPSLLGVDRQGVMRVLGQPVIDVLVADLAGVRSRVTRRKSLGGCPPGNSRQEHD